MLTIPASDPASVARYTADGWWGTDTLTDVIAGQAATNGNGLAIVDDHGDAMSWQTYDEISDLVAGSIIDAGVARGATIAILLPDGPLMHAAYVGADKAGTVVMALGMRSGEQEILHLLDKTNVAAIVTQETYRDEHTTALVSRLDWGLPSPIHHFVITGPSDNVRITVDGASTTSEVGRTLTETIAARRLGADELFLLNSTSGTTGLPKCVMQTQNRWFYFHHATSTRAGFGPGDVFLSAPPGAFGFGLWGSHIAPTLSGAPCVVMENFSPELAIELIERERATVLLCVATQFIMMLNSPEFDRHDLSSLRVMFAGGEAIPEHRAREFEERTGATTLIIYGSNESGIVSAGQLGDSPEKRFATAGRCIPEMNVRLFTPDGEALGDDATEGVPGCKGPALALGYYEDDEANASLFTADGWLLMGDVVRIDDDGWLNVIGRASDFIVRGGKNISARAVEDEVDTHPAVRIVAVLAIPDEVFGERVAAYVELYDNHSLTHDELREHLEGRGVSKEWIPEHLFVVDALPRSPGGKVAKGQLREDAAEQSEATSG
jgi:acyl-CoA synthetase